MTTLEKRSERKKSKKAKKDESNNRPWEELSANPELEADAQAAPAQPLGPRADRLRRNRRKGRQALRGGWRRAWEFMLLAIGSSMIALSFNLFFYPNQLASGGVTGISIIVQKLFGVEPAFTQWGLNIPLFLIGVLLLGRNFGIKTAIGSVLLPLLVLVTRNVPSLTSNVLLASIYGGILLGVGIGLVYRGRGSTGGFSVAAQVLHKYTGIGFGLCVALLDGAVIVAAGIFISPENAMYALIGLFVTSKTINVVQLGLSYSKVAFIISEAAEDIREVILYELDRGLTKLHATGGYTGEARTVLMVVVGQTEVTRLKELVRAVDPGAFVILSDTNEVLGEGFKIAGQA